jgi:hypothetical protein
MKRKKIVPYSGVDNPETGVNMDANYDYFLDFTQDLNDNERAEFDAYIDGQEELSKEQELPEDFRF